MTASIEVHTLRGDNPSCVLVIDGSIWLVKDQENREFASADQPAIYALVKEILETQARSKFEAKNPISLVMIPNSEDVGIQEGLQKIERIAADHGIAGGAVQIKDSRDETTVFIDTPSTTQIAENENEEDVEVNRGKRVFIHLKENKISDVWQELLKRMQGSTAVIQPQQNEEGTA